MYFAVGSASSDAASPRPAPLLQRARRLGIGQRDAHRLDLAAVGELKQILQETVARPAGARGLPASGQSQAASSAAAAACDRPRTDAGRRTPAAPSRWTRAKIRAGDVGADAERRDGGRQLVAIQVAQVQRFGGRPIARRAHHGSTLRPMPRPLRPPARRLAPSSASTSVDPADTRGHREGRGGRSGSRSSDDELSELENLLTYAGTHALLVVLQGRDASGKDGAIRKILEFSNIQQGYVQPFKVPTEEERAHDFLWRVHKAVPRRGHVALFNRSHYEDVLAARVHKLVARGGLEGALRAHQRVRAAARRQPTSSC